MPKKICPRGWYIPLSFAAVRQGSGILSNSMLIIVSVRTSVPPGNSAVREWLPALAALVGAKPPLRVPKWLARLIAGEHIVTMITETRGASNAKAKRDLSWRPVHASWRQGFAVVLAQAA